MKQIILCLFFIIAFSSQTFSTGSTKAQQLELKKETANGPSRAPALYPVSFSGAILMHVLTIYTQNYSGSIAVQITGTTSLNQTVQISDSNAVRIDINSLPGGEYHICILTDGQGVFNGDFSL